MTAIPNKKKKGLVSWLNQEYTAGYVFSLPFIFGFLMFMVIPMVLSLYYSFCKYDIQNPLAFIGLDNYIKIFTGDSTFYKALKVTCYYAFIGTPLKVIFALIVALILNHETKAVPIYRATYYLPSIIGGSVAVAILWRRLFESNGTINALLSKIFPGLAGFNWFSEGPAIWVLIILTVWQFGSSMVMFLAALKNVPASLYEAAEIDGAGWWKRFFHITIPQISPIIFFTLLNQTIQELQNYTSPALITGGGPRKSTYVMGMFLYQEGFAYFHMGYASAISWIMFIVILILTLIIFGTSRFWVHYSDE